MVPVTVIAEIVNKAVPVFLSVTVLAVLVVPMATVPKLKLVGDNTTAGPLKLNVAVTNLDEVIVTEQLPVPEQAPLQPVKPEPVAAFAVRVTPVPSGKPNTHLLGQLIPAGLLVTDP